MKLLEYEAKNILRAYNIPTPQSQVLIKGTIPEITLPTVLKSQVPIGGRGKLGGVQIVDDVALLPEVIESLFHLDIKGYLPTTLLAEEKLAIKNEYYFSLLINRESTTIELVAHADGGVEIESQDPAGFLKLAVGGDTDQSWNVIGEQLAEYLNIPELTFALQELVKNAYDCFVQNDATLLEINPLVLTEDGALIAGDCKMVLDDAASFRHPDWQFEDTPQDTNFVTLDERGTVATIANGAGLAMATVDAVTAAGMTPANFLDIGGGANTASVLAAFEQIMKFDHIEAIVINIFAGITRCDEVARAIIAAREQIDDLPPLFIRLAGTNFEEAVTLLSAERIATLATLDACLQAAKEAHHG